MRIGVVGTGYVGLVVGGCLAETGHDVVCYDISEETIGSLRAGRVPIHEPGLEPLIRQNLKAGRLHFTTDGSECVRASDIIFVAVGTPPSEDGSADLKHVLDVGRMIGSCMDGPKIVVTKSTVPVGTAALLRQTIEALTEHPLHVCSNPEFLKEGAAVEDFMKPDRVVLGVDSDHAAEVLRTLYEPFVRTGNEIVVMDPASAEVTKYAANAMLATRISLMNSLANLCERTGANVDAVRLGIGSDRRIGSSFLFPGVGYGGSCFGKDVRALVDTMRRHQVDPAILQGVHDVNEHQKRTLLTRVTELVGPDLTQRRIAVWGLSFKPNTNDMRDAPSLVTIEGLLAAGAEVVAHDPVAVPEARQRFGDRITYGRDNYDVLEGADALLIHTEWHPYRRPDFHRMKRLMARPLIVDGRNLYDPAALGDLGFEYHSIGRQPAGAVRALRERKMAS